MQTWTAERKSSCPYSPGVVQGEARRLRAVAGPRRAPGASSLAPKFRPQPSRVHLAPGNARSARSQRRASDSEADTRAPAWPPNGFGRPQAAQGFRGLHHLPDLLFIFEFVSRGGPGRVGWDGMGWAVPRALPGRAPWSARVGREAE